jgi:hypothetical protein
LFKVNKSDINSKWNRPNYGEADKAKPLFRMVSGRCCSKDRMGNGIRVLHIQSSEVKKKSSFGLKSYFGMIVNFPSVCSEKASQLSRYACILSMESSWTLELKTCALSIILTNGLASDVLVNFRSAPI